jgi:tetrahydromethanopterin S-methyltransferase subunit G
MSMLHLEEPYVEKNRPVPLTIEESLLDVLHTTETTPATPALKAIESVRTPEEQLEYSQRISKTLRRDIQWGIARGLFLFTLFMIPVVALIAGAVAYFLIHPMHF